MVKLFYTTYISVDLAHHEICRVKVGKGGINPVSQYIPFTSSVASSSEIQSRARS